MKPLISVITPTYNRGDKIKNLYYSLEMQTTRNFCWIVVDDGSTDETEQIINDLMGKSSFNIEYIKKENGGKHTAVNLGVTRVNTELVIIVDSDDLLLKNATEDIEEYFSKYANNNEVGFYTFLKCYKNGNVVVGLEKGEFIANYIDYRIKGNRAGDMAEVFITSVLKQFPFPEFSGEKFISEDVVWIELSKKFNTVYINKSIYECDYLEDGLSANDKLMKYSSPFGSMLRGKQLMFPRCGIKCRVKGAIIYNCYKKETKQSIPRDLIPTGIFNTILLKLSFPLGVYFNRKWRTDYGR